MKQSNFKKFAVDMSVAFWNHSENDRFVERHYIVCIAVSTPPQKYYPLFLAKPPSNQQTVQVPPF